MSAQMGGANRVPSSPADAVIELTPWRNGLWRWRFRDLDHDVALPSNRSYGSREAAEAAARVAFPGVPVAGEPGMAGSRVGVAFMALTVIGVVIAAATGVGLAVLLAIVLAKRKVRRRPARLR